MRRTLVLFSFLNWGVWRESKGSCKSIEHHTDGGVERRTSACRGKKFRMSLWIETISCITELKLTQMQPENECPSTRVTNCTNFRFQVTSCNVFTKTKRPCCVYPVMCNLLRGLISFSSQLTVRGDSRVKPKGRWVTAQKKRSLVRNHHERNKQFNVYVNISIFREKTSAERSLKEFISMSEA